MPTITKAALQWYEDEMESVVEQRDQLEEELEKSLEDNAEKDLRILALEAEITRIMSDRSIAV